MYSSEGLAKACADLEEKKSDGDVVVLDDAGSANAALLRPITLNEIARQQQSCCCRSDRDDTRQRCIMVRL